MSANDKNINLNTILNAGETVMDATLGNAAIIIRIATFILALGAIGYILWNLPIVELFYMFFYVFIIPMVFLTALGVVSIESFKVGWAGAKFMRDAVNTHLNK